MASNLLALALLVVVFHTVQSSYGGPSLLKAWTTWKVEHGKQYSTKEDELVGWDTWVRNKRLVDEHNLAYDEGKRSFKMTMNAYADQDLSKIRNRLNLMPKQLPTETKRRPSSSSSSSTSSIPSSWDWRKEGKVNEVKNQGQIDSSLAIDVADAVASYSAIIDQTDLYELADQEVIDCCLPDEIVDPNVFDCINDHGGLCLNGAYHSGSPPKVCNNASCKAVASCNVGKAVTNGNETVLAEAVYSTPVVVAVDASHVSFQLYVSGVYSDPDCSTTQLDHALLLVGYGVTSAGTEYWICRNSWGKSWGENGYINIARNHHNMCGIASDAIYPSKN